MDADEVDLAVCAVVQEVSKPAEAHLAAAVGDGGRTKLCLAGEGHHVSLVAGCCCAGRDIRLRAEIGLVECQQVF